MVCLLPSHVLGFPLPQSGAGGRDWTWSLSSLPDVGVDPTLEAPQSEAAEGAELWWAGGHLGWGSLEGIQEFCMHGNELHA